MLTVEGEICAAVLLVRLAHPHLAFTVVSGWAMMVQEYDEEQMQIKIGLF